MRGEDVSWRASELENKWMNLSQTPLGRLVLLAVIFAFFSAVPPPLFSATVSNEGRTTVKVNARSSQGIVGGSSLKPGQSVHLRDDLLWVEHVSEGGVSEVHLKITENDGRMGMIDALGGRYVFRPAASPGAAVRTEKKKRALTDGYAENRCNLAMTLSLTNEKNGQSDLLLWPGHKGAIPKDTVQVIATRHGWSSGVDPILLFLVMPDGKEHTIVNTNAVIRVDPDANE